MKYMMLITQGEWYANGAKGDRDAAMAKVVDWWGKGFASGTILAGHQLQGPETATTVVIERGKHTLLDRALLEAKEAIGGYGIIEAPDLDAALTFVRTMPQPDGKVEVRPVFERPQ